MFDGQVKVSGTVKELVFDDTVADVYLGPTLSARLRARFANDPDPVPPAAPVTIAESPEYTPDFGTG
jgi:hypothetical protein